MTVVVNKVPRGELMDSLNGNVRVVAAIEQLIDNNIGLVTTTTGDNTGDNSPNSLYSGLVTNATHTGEVTGSGYLTISSKAVTLSKMGDVATGTVFYRKSGGTGTPEVQTLSTLKTDLAISVPTGSTPALTLGTANAAGTASTFVRTDATLLAFDTTNPAAAGSASPGSATVAARRDHIHPAQTTVSGNAGTVSNATFTTALNVNTGSVTLTGNVANSSVLTIGSGAVSVSGANTGDQLLTFIGHATSLNYFKIAEWTLSGAYGTFASHISVMTTAKPSLFEIYVLAALQADGATFYSPAFMLKDVFGTIGTSSFWLMVNNATLKATLYFKNTTNYEPHYITRIDSILNTTPVVYSNTDTGSGTGATGTYAFTPTVT
jgi:hypothetical protein